MAGTAPPAEFVAELASARRSRSGMMACMLYDVVWPKSPMATARRPLSPRLTGGLAGRRVGFLWDYLFRGEELFPALAEVLRAHGAEVVSYDAFGNLHGPHEAQLVGEIPSVIAARGIDAVVSGVGA